jgi:hypothetical protein
MGMDTTSGANKLQILINQCLKRFVWVGAKDPRVATTPLLGKLATPPVKVTATSARTSAFLKAPTLNTCISDLVGQYSRMRPITWTFGIVRWLDRFARASAKLT